MTKKEIAEEFSKNLHHPELANLLDRYISNLPKIEQNEFEFDSKDFQRLHEIISHYEKTNFDLIGIQNPCSFIGAHYFHESDLF